MPLLSIAVAHWKFDEAGGAVDAPDGIGSITLAQTGSPASVAGKVGTCRSLVAAGPQYFSVASDATLRVSSSYDWGFTWWTKLTSKAMTMHLIGNRTAALDYWVRYDAGADRLELVVWAPAAASSATVRADALGSPSTATWYFGATWFDSAAQTINIQINNGTVNSAAWTASTNNTSTTFEIGAGAGGETWDGLVDEITLFKNGFPTAAERTAIYNGGSGVPLATLLAIGGASSPWAVAFGASRPPGVRPYDSVRFRGGRR